MQKAWFFAMVVGAAFIIFTLGAATLFYRLPSSDFFANAFNAAKAWQRTLQEEEPLIEVEDPKTTDYSDINERILANSKTVWDQKKAYNGYTLVSTGFMDAAWLVDMNGKIVHRWDMPFKRAWPDPKHIHPATKASTFIDCALVFPNGDLLAQYSAIGDTPYGYGIAKLNKYSKVLWTYNENAHHDLHIDSETGEIYGLIHKMIREPVKGLESLPYPMLSDYIVRLSANGKELDRISILEAFQNSPFEAFLYHERNGALAKWDYIHANSVMPLEKKLAAKFPMFTAGQILVSIRSMHAIAVIDPKTRKVVWAMNGTWKMQHAARFLDNGHIILFDNLGRSIGDKDYSSIIELDPKTLETKWSFSGSEAVPFRTNIVGRLQRLANGNTLIAESMPARIFEVTPKGEIVWSYKLQRVKRKDPTLNAILTSVRYREEELPFLQELLHAPR